MSTLLLALNAKYIHSNIAVRYLQKYAAPFLSQPPQILELTINNRMDFILDEIFRRSPDLLLFSTYIWNVDLVRRLAAEYRKLRPDALIGGGGPEVSYESEAFLRQNPAFDLIVRGEGEETVRHLLAARESGLDWTILPGLTVRSGQAVRTNPPRSALDLASLPFPYEADLSDTVEQIKYYESSRGCPFQCQYCLSSIEKGVRAAPLDKVFADLEIFLRAKARQVKFVDRTFNYDAQRALAIWRFLHDHDNGITNFHFELEAELLTEEQLVFLAKMRPGLFQFEIGVQSANPDTLQAVNRKTDLSRLAEIVKRLRQPRNIHLHLDLIAGLPLENYESFGRSFDTVYRMEPDQLQLGFLKLLKGSGLRQDAGLYGIHYRNEPPYEVLCTDVLPFSDLLRLKDVEEQLERYGNSGRFSASVAYLVGLSDRPFTFYEKFSAWYRAEGLHLTPHTKLDQYEILYRYGCTLPGCEPKILGFKMRYDLFSHENCKSLPNWLPALDTPANRDLRRRFFSNPEYIARYLPEYIGLDPKLIEKTAHLDFFPFHPLNGGQPCACLFNYRRRNPLGFASVQFLNLFERNLTVDATDSASSDTICTDW